MRKKPKYRWVLLPPDFASTVTDCTIAEAASFRRCSIWTIFEKIRAGEITAFKDGRVTKITVASLVRDRDRALAATRVMPSRTSLRPLDAAEPVVAETKTVLKKRPVGRPRKHAEEHPAPASTRRVLEATS